MPGAEGAKPKRAGARKRPPARVGGMSAEADQPLIAAWAAASRATGTRNGEQLT